MKIGDIELENPVIVAPLAGISNLAFRKIAKRFGAGLVCNEMVSDKGLYYNSDKTKRMLASDKSEHPVSFQLFGHDIDTCVYAARYLDQNTECDIIDFNMGCPVNKVVKSKAGSWLLQDPAYAKELMMAVTSSVKKPVTVKMRTGFDEDHITCVEMAKNMEEAGVKAITIHGRTRKQMYTGKADWSWIKKVKDSVGIPVIGNGDIKSSEDMIAMMEQTGCDGVMIGRGIIGNPFLIQECADVFSNSHHEFTLKERMDVCLQHAYDLSLEKGEKTAIREMRNLAGWYIKGLPHSHAFKQRLNEMNTLEDLKNVLDEYYAKAAAAER